MARIVKEHGVRKNEILDVAYALIYSRGYEQTTVEAIIRETAIAKGTFYHYFKSKLDLLDSLVERMTDRMVEAGEEVIRSDLDAIQKFRRLFEVGGAIKFEHREMLIPALRYLVSDENLVARNRTMRRMIEKLKHVYTDIIRQGVSEGVFDTPYVDDAVELILGLWSVLGDVSARLLFDLAGKPGNMDLLKHKLRMYENAAERILGAREGSLKLYDWELIDDFASYMMKEREAANDTNG